jgi:L-Ala-D/L-Glu epimerase
MDAAIRGHGAAKCALDIALHDLAGKRLGVSVRACSGVERRPADRLHAGHRRAGGRRRARRRARPASRRSRSRSAGPADVATLEAVREVYDGPIRVDANTGWTPRTRPGAPARTCVERLGVELIEQPFPPRRLDQLRWLQERSPLPIVADESAVTIEDLDALVGVVAGVNVKLAKCGGVGAARRMLARARELGFRTFLGCMEETSVGIAASAAVAPLAEWVDLDGCLLLADDPFEGLELGRTSAGSCRMGPGLGLGDGSRARA